MLGKIRGCAAPDEIKIEALRMETVGVVNGSVVAWRAFQVECFGNVDQCNLRLAMCSQ